MECFLIIVHSWKLFTIITKHSILDVAAVLDALLKSTSLLFFSAAFAAQYFSLLTQLLQLHHLWPLQPVCLHNSSFHALLPSVAHGYSYCCKSSASLAVTSLHSWQIRLVKQNQLSFPSIEINKPFLAPITVCHISDSSLEANSSCCHRSDAKSHLH